MLHGPHLARFKPRTYSIIFIIWDIVSLVLQAAGGALADTSKGASGGQTGINIMIAGLASQVASLVVFVACCADYALRARRDRDGVANRTYQGLAKMGSSSTWRSALVLGE